MVSDMDNILTFMFSGKVTDIKDNLTEEEKMLMAMNKEKRAKYLAKKEAAATA